MTKPSIGAQLKRWLEGRRRWLRSGGNNLVHYLSIMLDNNDQVDALIGFLTADVLPDWLYVERDGNRITLVGLSAWRDDQTIESDEVPAELWDVVMQLRLDNIRLCQALARMEADRNAYRDLCDGLTDPAAADSAPLVTAPEVARVACECGSLRQQLEAAERQNATLRSVGVSNEGLKRQLQAQRNAAQAAERASGRALEAMRSEFAQHLLGVAAFISTVVRGRRVDQRVLDAAQRQVIELAHQVQKVAGPAPEKVAELTFQLEQQLV